MNSKSIARIWDALGNIPPLWLGALAALIGDACGQVDARVAPGLALISFGVLVLGRYGPRRPTFRFALAIVLSVACAVRSNRVRHPPFPASHIALLPTRVAIPIEGVLRADIPLSAEQVRVQIDSERARVNGAWRHVEGRLQVSLSSSNRPWQAGDRIRAEVRLRHPRNFGNPDEFDVETYMARRAIYVTSYLRSDAEFTLVGHDFSVWDWVPAWRRSLASIVEANVAWPASRVLSTLIIGSDRPLPRDLYDDFSRAGVSHVLSISGLHVGLVAASSYAAVHWLLARNARLLLRITMPKLAIALSALPVFLYAAIAGDNVATRRSVFMIALFLGGVMVDRGRNLTAALAAAALLLVWMSPGTSLDISFQLSFVAVLALTLATNRFQPWWQGYEEEHLLRLRERWRRRAQRSIALYAVVAVSALMSTLPLTAFYFNRVSLVAPLANALVVPILGTAAVALGLIATMLLPLSVTAATWVIWATGPVVELGVWLTHLCARLPFAGLRSVTPSVVELSLLYGAMTIAVYGRGTSRRVTLMSLAILLGIDGWHWFEFRYRHQDLRVTFVSVGQGDSAVVEFPGGEVMVIDGGGSFSDSFDIGERVLAPYLWSRKIGRVDYLVLSHPDRDHYAGLTFLAAEFSPREIWTTGASSPADGFRELLETVDENRIVRRIVRGGEQSTIGGVTVRALSPTELGTGGDNDDSLVLAVEYSGRRILFTGDIERAGESMLVENYSTDLPSAVLKVPHHGSRTSSNRDFVDTVAPTIAVFSVGHENRFGFPHRDVLKRYENVGARILRSDLDGAIYVVIDENGDLQVTTTRFSPPSSVQP